MSQHTRRHPDRLRNATGTIRILTGATTLIALGVAYALAIRAGQGSPFDYFGYFTNLTSLATSGIVITAGVYAFRGNCAPLPLVFARGVSTACMIVVGVVYNALVPGTGAAPPWVNAWLHIALPMIVTLDWLISRDRRPLPLTRLWIVLPYPLLWLTVVLIRGATDGWVPYGFLLPATGPLSITLHGVGLLAALISAGALVWGASHLPTILHYGSISA